MLVPFGTRVVDKNGKGVGTVSRVVLHAGSRDASGIVVHQGVLDRRQIVVPVSKVSRFGDGDVQLALSAADLAGLDLYNAAAFQRMPDHWKMPIGFDQREFFLVGGDGWTEAVLPFASTSPAVSGTPELVPKTGTSGPRDPAIAGEEEVFDSAGQKVGEVHAVEIDPATDRIVRIVVRRGTLFRNETSVPASLIASAGGKRITLSVGGDAVKKLERA